MCRFHITKTNSVNIKFFMFYVNSSKTGDNQILNRYFTAVHFSIWIYALMH